MHAAGLLRQAEASVCPLDTQPVIKECFQLNLDAVITASTKYYEEITFRRHSAVGKAGVIPKTTIRHCWLAAHSLLCTPSMHSQLPLHVAARRCLHLRRLHVLCAQVVDWGRCCSSVKHQCGPTLMPLAVLCNAARCVIPPPAVSTSTSTACTWNKHADGSCTCCIYRLVVVPAVCSHYIACNPTLFVRSIILPPSWHQSLVRVRRPNSHGILLKTRFVTLTLRVGPKASFVCIKPHHSQHAS